MKPAKGRKNEYQRRVSPIVRNGGRSNETHIIRIKLKNTARPMMVDVLAITDFSRHAAQAPTVQSTTATIAKYIK